MPKRLESAKLPLCQRRFERSRLEAELWSAAYQELVPEGRHPVAGTDSAARGKPKPAQEEVPVVSYFVEEECA